MNAYAHPHASTPQAPHDDQQLWSRAHAFVPPRQPIGTKGGVVLSALGGAFAVAFALAIGAWVLQVAAMFALGPSVARIVGIVLGLLCFAAAVAVFVMGITRKAAALDAAGVHLHFGATIPWTDVASIRYSQRTYTTTKTERRGNMKKVTKTKHRVPTIELTDAAGNTVRIDTADCPYTVAQCELAKALADWSAQRVDRTVVETALRRLDR